jgi:hypothetical protein
MMIEAIIIAMMIEAIIMALIGKSPREKEAQRLGPNRSSTMMMADAAKRVAERRGCPLKEVERSKRRAGAGNATSGAVQARCTRLGHAMPPTRTATRAL